MAAVDALEQPCHEEAEVLLALAQRRNGQGEAHQTGLQILTESPLRHEQTEVSVGGGHHPQVDRKAARTPHRPNLALLQHA